MATLAQVQPVDGYGESLVSFGEAIGAANSDFDSKVATLDLGKRGIVSSSNSLSTYVKTATTKLFTYAI